VKSCVERGEFLGKRPVCPLVSAAKEPGGPQLAKGGGGGGPGPFKGLCEQPHVETNENASTLNPLGPLNVPGEAK
jgi:hypothetical protein